MDYLKRSLSAVIVGNYELHVPMYQRQYQWPDERAKIFWNDVLAASTSKDVSHWMGTMVRQQDGEGVGGAKRYLLIDGQQRMTALLLLCASIRHVLLIKKIATRVTKGEEIFYEFDADIDKLIAERAKASGSKPRMHIPMLLNLEYFLRTDGEEVSRILTASEDDREGFDSVVYEMQVPNNKVDKRVRHGRQFVKFQTWFQEYIKGKSSLEIVKSTHAIFDGLERMELLFLDIDVHRDDPQQIFESINYKGEPLSSVDIIRNYVIGLPPAREDRKRLFDSVWEPIQEALQQILGPGEQLYRKSLFDEFFKSYVSMEQGDSSEKNVFPSFKAIISKECPDKKNYDALSTKLSTVRDYALSFEKMAAYYSADLDHSSLLKARVQSFSKLGLTSPMSFLMCAHGPGTTSRWSDEELVKAIDVLESYFVRRFLLGKSVRGMSEFFAFICNRYASSREAIETAGDLAGWLRKSLHLHSIDHTTVEPPVPGAKDFSHLKPVGASEFNSAIPTEQVYSNSANVTRYVLAKIDTIQNPNEFPNRIESYDIEHVLPQDYKPWIADIEDWNKDVKTQAERDEIATALQDTLGNLTLSNYNKNLKNKRFVEKRDLQIQKKNGIILNAGYTWSNVAETRAIAFEDQQLTIKRSKWSFADIRARTQSLGAKVRDIFNKCEE